MIIVVDTNIIFSGVLSPNGKICDLLFNSDDVFEFYAPSAVLYELNVHRVKLLNLSGLSEEELNFLIVTLLKKIELIDLDSVKKSTWEKALELTKDVDEFDTPFIALSLELSAPLWTGDKKLTQGLSSKGVDWVFNTEQVKRIRDDVS